MAAGDQADLFGCRAAEVDGATASKRAAVVDAHGHAAASARVGHLDKAAKGQGAVRGGHRAHVEPLAIGGSATMEAAAVIGGDAGAQTAGGGLLFDWRFETVEVDGMSRNREVGVLEAVPA
mgnify:CR=1 FL=1